MSRFLEMRNVHMPTLAGRTVELQVALAWASDSTQIEIITPVSGDDAIYRILPENAAYSVLLHHIGQIAATPAEFDRYREESLSEELALAIDTPFYFMVDTRSTLGHCIEFINAPECMSPEMLAIRDSIPRN